MRTIFALPLIGGIACTCGLSHRAAADEATPVQKAITNKLGMKLSLIPSGEFLRGAAETDVYAEADERPRHRVRITRPFYLGIHEVTRGQFARFVLATAFRSDAERDAMGGAGWVESPRQCIRRSTEFNWH